MGKDKSKNTGKHLGLGTPNTIVLIAHGWVLELEALGKSKRLAIAVRICISADVQHGALRVGLTTRRLLSTAGSSMPMKGRGGSLRGGSGKEIALCRVAEN